MISEGNWQIFYNANNQNDPLNIPLNFPIESILVKVTLSTPQTTWRRAGWFNQYWEDDGNLWLLKSAQIQLNGHLMTLSLTNKSLLVFNPVPWLVNWNISLFAPVQSIDKTDEKLDEILERLPNPTNLNNTLLL